MKYIYLIALCIVLSSCATGGRGDREGGRDGGDATIETTVGDLPECASVTGNVQCKNVDATRIFTVPEAYPPSGFAAYGIIAFGSRAMPADIDRHLMICEAYSAALAHAFESDVQQSEQLVTVWPVTRYEVSVKLNYAPRAEVCQPAVRYYDLLTAQKAYRDAELAGAKLSGIGPYLLAWSPSDQKGQMDALVLVADLSTVTTPLQAQNVFNNWRNDIEMDPLLWKNGWDLDRVRLKIQQWADLYGERMVTMLIQ